MFRVRANLTEVPVDLRFRWKNRIVYLIAETGQSGCNARAELLVAFHDGRQKKGQVVRLRAYVVTLCFTTIVGSTPTGKTHFCRSFRILAFFSNLRVLPLSRRYRLSPKRQAISFIIMR